MKSIASTFFETKVQYNKMMDDGKTKKVSETYAMDAHSFSEAESITTEQVAYFIHGEFAIVAEKIAPYREVFLSDKPNDSFWFLVKVAIITVDEKTAKEKKQFVKHLVQAADVQTAHEYITEEYNKTICDYEIASISDTPILDVFTHD